MVVVMGFEPWQLEDDPSSRTTAVNELFCLPQLHIHDLLVGVVVEDKRSSIQIRSGWKGKGGGIHHS